MGSKKGKFLALAIVIVMLVALSGALILSACDSGVTVIFDAGAGTFESGNSIMTLNNVAPGTVINLKDYNPKNGGQKFVGWDDESLMSYTDEYTIPSDAKGVIKLTAKWRAGTSGGGSGVLSPLFSVLNSISKGDKINTHIKGSGISGGKEYGLEYISNISRGLGNNALDYDLGFQLTEDGTPKLGIYIVDIKGAAGGLFIDTKPSDPDSKPIYIEDFNMDYLLSVAEKLPSFLQELLNSQSLVSGIIDGVVLSMFMSVNTTTSGSVTNYDITISPLKLVNGLTSLLENPLIAGVVGGFLSSIDLNPLLTWLKDNVPDVDFIVRAGVNSAGQLAGNIELDLIDNSVGESTFTFNTAQLTHGTYDSETLSLVPDKVNNYVAWSLGNIKFSANLDLSTAGNNVDVGALINTFVPGTLPQGLILLDANLGYRLDAIIDIDIKQANPAEDKNLIAIELYEKGKYGSENAILGVYYRNGSLYINIGNILNKLPSASGNGEVAKLWSGKGIKISGLNLNELVGAIKQRAVSEIDKLFGTDHGKIEQSGMESTLKMLTQHDSVMALSVDEEGETYISPGWGNFISMLFKVLKIDGEYVDVTNTADGGELALTINNNLIDSIMAALKGLIPNFGGIDLPDIGEGKLFIKVNKYGLESIGIDHTIGGINLGLSLSDFLLLQPIMFGDDDAQQDFASYIDSCVGDESGYTTSINELINEVLYGGIKGSINLDLSFSGGEYNLSELLSMFGLSLGDIKIKIDNPNAKIALGLDFGLYIDENNPDRDSALYLELVAREPVYLENPDGGTALINEGIILGIYLYKDAIYLDASNLKILNLEMPIYKLDNVGAGSAIEALLAQLPNLDLNLDLSGVIESIKGNPNAGEGEAEAAAALAELTKDSGGVLSTSQVMSNSGAIALYLGSDAIKLSATVGAIFTLLSTFNVNLGFDINDYIQGEIPLDIEYRDGKLSLKVTANLLSTVDGKDSNLTLALGIDLADVNIAGCKQEIKERVDNVGSDYINQELDDYVIKGLLNAVLDTQISINIMLKQGRLDVLKLVDYLLTTLKVSVSLSDLDLDGSIGTDSLEATLNIKLAMSNSDNPIMGIELIAGETGSAGVLFSLYLDKNNAYIDLNVLGLGKYKVSNTGLMGMLTDLLDGFSESVSLKGLLNLDSLLDVSKTIALKAITSVNAGTTVVWNRYGQANDIYYNVYGVTPGVNGAADTVEAIAMGVTHNDASIFVDGKFMIVDADNRYGYYRVDVCTLKNGNEKVIVSATTSAEDFDYGAKAEYSKDIKSTDISWNVYNGKYKYAVTQIGSDGQSRDVDISSAVIEGGVFKFTADATGVVSYKVRVFIPGEDITVDEFTFAVTKVDSDKPQEPAAIDVAINDIARSVSWSGVEGASYYEVSLAIAGAAAAEWTTKVSAGGNLTTKWYNEYKNYSITVVAYDKDGNKITEGASSTSYNIIDALLSGLTINNGIIGLEITGKVFGDILANLIGENYRIEILDVALRDVNIFTGTADLELNIYDSIGPDAGKITVSAGIAISPTDVDALAADVEAMNAEGSGYSEIDFAFGGNVVKGIWDLFDEGVMLGMDLEINFAKGSYNLSKLFAMFGDNLASMLENGPVWTFEADTSVKLELKLGIILDDISKLSEEARKKLPQGMLKAPQIMLSIGFPQGLVLGNDVAIKPNSSIDVFLNYEGLSIDLSGISILGLTLPKYRAEGFDFFGFLNGYLLKLEQMIGAQYNPDGLVIDAANSSVITSGDTSALNLKWKSYVGAEGYSYVVNKAGAESSEEVKLGKDATSATIDVTGLKDGDNVTLNVLDTMGNAYASAIYYAKIVDGELTFELNVGQARMARAQGDDVSLMITKDKLSLMITSQALLSIIKLVYGDKIDIDLPDLDLTIFGEIGNIDGVTGILLKVVGDLIKPEGYVGTDPTLEMSLKLYFDSGEAVKNLNIGDKYAAFIAAADNAGSKLISGLLDSLFNTSFSLYIDLAAEQGFDIIDVLNMFIGDKIDLSTLNLDTIVNNNSGNKLLELKLTTSGSYSDFEQVAILLQINYMGKELIALAVRDGDAYLDLSGIGAGVIKVTDSSTPLTANIKKMLDDMIGKIEIDIEEKLNGLLGIGKPQQGNVSTLATGGADQAANAAAPIDTSSLIAAIIDMVVINDSVIKLYATSEMIKGLLNQFFSISLNIELNGDIDIFNGEAQVNVSLKDSADKAITLSLGLSINAMTNAELSALEQDLDGRAASFDGVVIDLSNIVGSVADLLNGLDLSIELDVNFGANDNVNLWDVIGVILTSLVKADGAVNDVFEALGEQGFRWQLDTATDINLKLKLATDIRTKTVNGEEVIDEETSAIVVGLIAGTDLTIGYDATDNNREVIIKQGEGIYLVIKGGKLYIDLSCVHILGLTLPVLRADNFDVMSYLTGIVGDVKQAVDKIFGGTVRSEAEGGDEAATVGSSEMALDGGSDGSILIGQDITFSIGLKAVLSLLSEMGLVDLTALKLDWNIVATTGVQNGLLKIAIEHNGESTPIIGFNAALTLGVKLRGEADQEADAERADLLDKATDADVRYADSTSNVIDAMLNKVLNTTIKLGISAHSASDKFNISRLLSQLIGLIATGSNGLDSSKAFNIDVSDLERLELTITLSGKADNLSQLSAMIRIDSVYKNYQGVDVNNKILAIYVDSGNLYADLSALLSNVNIIKINNSAIMNILSDTLNKLLSGVNLDLNDIINIAPKAQQPDGGASLAPAAAADANALDVAELIKSVAKIVRLHNTSIALEASTDAIDQLLFGMFGIHLDVLDVNGAIYLINGRAELNANIYDYDGNALTVGLGLSIAENGIDETAALKSAIAHAEATAVELDFTNGKTLAQTVLDVLGGVSLQLDVKVQLPEGVFGIGDLLSGFGIDIADANAFELIISGGDLRLDASLIAKAAFDYDNPNNTTVMLEVVMNSDAVFGAVGGEDNIVFHAGDRILGIYIKGSELYVDLSSLTLLGIELPVYYTANFNIQGFINYLLNKLIGGLDSMIFGEFAVNAEYSDSATKMVWNKVDGADAYLVKVNGEKVGTVLADAEVDGKYAFTPAADKLTGIYTVEVVPMVKKAVEGTEQFNYVEMGGRIGKYTNAFNLYTSYGADGSANIAWDRISGAQFYTVKVNGEKIADTEETSIVIDNLVGGEVIEVVPYKTVDDVVQAINDYIGRIVFKTSQAPVSTVAGIDDLDVNELFLLGISRDQINIKLSLDAVQAILQALNLDVALGGYDAVIDLTLKPNQDWLSLSFESNLGEAYGGTNASGEIALSVFDIYNGDALDGFKQSLASDSIWDILASKKDNAYSNIVDGLLDKMLNLSATLDISVSGDTALNLRNVLNSVFSQIDQLKDLSITEDIMLELSGLDLQLALNLGIDLSSVNNTVISIALNDMRGGKNNLLGIHLFQGKLIIDATGIAFGRYVIEGTELFQGLFDMLNGAISGLRNATDMDGLLDMLYGLVDKTPEQTGDSISMADTEEKGNLPAGTHSIAVRVSTDANAGTTTFSWDSVPTAMRYRLMLYSGYDLTNKTNLIREADFMPAGLDICNTVRETSVTFSTAALNKIGFIKDSMSPFDGVLQSGYYYFVVEAVRKYGADSVEPVYSEDGLVINGGYTNFSVLKSILSMVKIKNDKISLTASAATINKLLAGTLGINFDWASVVLDIDLFDGIGNLDFTVSDGDRAVIADNVTLQKNATSVELGWDTVENADYYEINITDISGKNKIDTVQVHSGDMTVSGNRASYSVDATAYPWLLTKELRYRVSAIFDSVNTAVINLTLATGDNGREKAVEAMKENGILVEFGENSDYTIAPEIPSLSEINGVSIKQFVEGILSVVRLEASLDIFISRGSYNISSLINSLLEKLNLNVEGLDESGIVWTLTDDLRFTIDLKLLFSLGATAEDTKFVLEVSSGGLSLTEADGSVIGVINEGLLLGLYYQNGNAFVDLSNVTLLGIQMPCYTFDIDVHGLLTDLIDNLFKDFDFSVLGKGLSVNVEGNANGDRYATWNNYSKSAEYKVEVFKAVDGADGALSWVSAGSVTAPAGATRANITSLVGRDSRYKVEVTAFDAEGSEIAKDEKICGVEAQEQRMSLASDMDSLDMRQLIMLGISSDKLHLEVTTKAVASLLASFISGNETVAMITDILGLFDLRLVGEWQAKEALTLKLQGDLFNTDFKPVAVACDNVSYVVSDDLRGVTFTWDEIDAADGYELTIKNSSDVTVATAKSDTNSVYVPFDSIFTQAVLAPNGGSWSAVGIVENPLNVTLKLHTEKLLNPDEMGKVPEEIDDILAGVDIDKAKEEYGSKLIAGLLDKIYNLDLSIALDFSQVDGFSLSEVLSVMVGNLILGATGISVGELTDALDLRLSTDATTVALDIMLNVDRVNPADTNIAIQLSSVIGGYNKDILLALYIYSNKLVVDMRAIGLRAYEIRNLEYIVSLQEELFGLIDSLIGDIEIDITEVIGGLLNPKNDVNGDNNGGDVSDEPGVGDSALGEETLPSIGVRVVNSRDSEGNRVTALKWNDVDGAVKYVLTMPAEDGSKTEITLSGNEYEFVSSASVYGKPYEVKIEAYNADDVLIAVGSRGANGVIASLLNALSLHNSIIRLDVTSDILDTILSTLLKDISINMDPIDSLDANIDIFNGNAEAKINLVLKQGETGAVVNNLVLGATLGLAMAPELYKVDSTTGISDPDTVIQKSLDAIGEVTVVDLGVGDPAGRIANAIFSALSTSSLSVDISVAFNAGTYDLAELLKSFGLDILGDTHLYWTFNRDTEIALTLELSARISPNAYNDSLLLLDIKAGNDIIFPAVSLGGKNYGEFRIDAGDSILSVFGRSNTNGTSYIYLDLSGFSVLGIPLPVLRAEYNFGRMIINEIYDLAAKITGQYKPEIFYEADDQGNMRLFWEAREFGVEQIKYDFKVVNADNNAEIVNIKGSEFLNGNNVVDTSYVLGKDKVATRMNVSITAYFEYTLTDGKPARRIVAENTAFIDLSSQAEVAEYSADDVNKDTQDKGLDILDTVKLEYTGLNKARASWLAKEGVVAYEIYLVSSGTGARIPMSRDVAEQGKATVIGAGRVEGYDTLGINGDGIKPGTEISIEIDTSPLFASAGSALGRYQSMFASGLSAPAPSIGNVNSSEDYYGYYIVVNCYGNVKETEDSETPAVDKYELVARGAADSYGAVNVNFVPKSGAAAGKGNYIISWDNVPGAVRYSVLPYYSRKNITSAGMTVDYIAVGKSSSAASGYNLSDLLVTGNFVNIYNVDYSGAYNIELCAYDTYGNIVGYSVVTNSIKANGGKLVPMAVIEIIAKADQLGIVVQLDAVAAMLDAFGVSLGSFDLGALDLEAAVGLKTYVERVVKPTDVGADKVDSVDVYGAHLKGLNSGYEYTVKITHTNEGRLISEKEYSLNSDYSGKMDVEFIMNALGEYNFCVFDNSGAKVIDFTSRTLKKYCLDVVGDLMQNVNTAGAVVNAGETSGSVTAAINSGALSYTWSAIEGATNYSVRVDYFKDLSVSGAPDATETKSVSGTSMQSSLSLEQGSYLVTVTAGNGALSGKYIQVMFTVGSNKQLASNAGKVLGQIGVTTDGRLIYWNAMSGAYTYGLDICERENGKIVKSAVYDGLTGTVHSVTLNHAGSYDVIVRGYDADGNMLPDIYSAHIDVGGRSDFVINATVSYDDIVIGGGESDYNNLSNLINTKANAYHSGDYATTVRMLMFNYLQDVGLGLKLDLSATQTVINMADMINKIFNAVNGTSPIGAPIRLDIKGIRDMGMTLNLEWHLDYTRNSTTQMVTGINGQGTTLKVELNYYEGNNTKTLLGFYLKDRSFYIALQGLGLFNIKMSSNRMINNLTGTLYSVLDNLTQKLDDTIDGALGTDAGDGIDFSVLLKALLGEYAEIDLGSIIVGNSVLETDELQPVAKSESLQDMDISYIITKLLGVVSLENSSLLVNATSAIIDTVFADLLGVELGLDLDLSVLVGILNGDIAASLRIDNVTIQAELDLHINDGSDYSELTVPNMNFIDLNVEQSSGTQLAMSLIASSGLNLSIDLSNASVESIAFYNYDADGAYRFGYPAAVRVSVEALNEDRTISENLNGSMQVERGGLLVTLVGIDTNEYNTKGAGTTLPLAYVYISPNDSLTVKLAKGWFIIEANAIGINVTVDLGDNLYASSMESLIRSFVPAGTFPVTISVPNLGIMNTLGGLLDKVINLIIGDESSSGNTGDVTEEDTSSGTGETVVDYGIKVYAYNSNNPVVEGSTFRIEHNRATNADGVAFDGYNLRVMRADGYELLNVTYPASATTSGGKYGYNVNFNWYEDYRIVVEGYMNKTGFDKILGELDIWALLGGNRKGSNPATLPTGGAYPTAEAWTEDDFGITAALSGTGNFNLSVDFDTYYLNKLIDDIMDLVFGANTILDLSSMGLRHNYLSHTWWDRTSRSSTWLNTMDFGSNGSRMAMQFDPTSTLDSISVQLMPLLADALELININIDVSVGPAIKIKLNGPAIRAGDDNLKSNETMANLNRIFMHLLPFAVWNTASLNVSLIDGTIANISFDGEDKGLAVRDENGRVLTHEVQTFYGKYNEGESRDQYYYDTGKPDDFTYSNMSGRGGVRKLTSNGRTKTSTVVRNGKSYTAYGYTVTYNAVGVAGSNSGGLQYSGAISNTAGTSGSRMNLDFTYVRTGSAIINRSTQSGTGFNTGSDSSQWGKPMGTTFVVGQNDIAPFHTKIDIYNGSASVGNSSTTTDHTSGIVSWGGLPAYVEYDPLAMGDAYAAADYMMKRYFLSGLTARYQLGSSFARGQITYAVNGATLTAANLASALSSSNEVTVVATAVFGGAVGSKSLSIVVHRNTSTIVSIDKVKMHYFDSLPQYVVVTTSDGKRKKYDVTTNRNKVGDENKVLLTDYDPATVSAAQGATVKAKLTFVDGTVSNLFEIEYVDSTLSLENSNELDLYSFNNIDDVVNAINGIKVTYADGDAVLSDDMTLGNGGSGSDMQVYSAKSGRWIALGTWAGSVLDIKGDTIYIPVSVSQNAGDWGSGRLSQSSTIVINIATKLPEYVTVRDGEADTVVVRPYDHYLSLVKGDDSLAALPGSITAHYANGTSEKISVRWKNADGRYVRSNSIITGWNTMGAEGKLYVENDEVIYQKFHWAYGRDDLRGKVINYKMESGRVVGMMFDLDGDGVYESATPDMKSKQVDAQVEFSGGYKMILPVALDIIGNRLIGYVGYDVEAYKANSLNICDYEGYSFKQAFSITKDASSLF